MIIKTAKVTGKEKIEVVETELPILKDNNILIKVLACGICSTEMAVFKGETIGVEGCSFHYKSYPANLGHEVVGYVEDLGPKVLNFRKGDLVSGLTYSGCGLAEFVIEPEDMLIKIDQVTKGKEHLYILEPFMATTNIIHQLKISFGDSVAIVGDGFMSMLLVCMLSRYPLKNLIVVGHHDWRLDLIKRFGASTTINSLKENAREIITEVTDGSGVDISVEYAGSRDALILSASICKAKVRSQLVLGSSYSNETPFVIANYLQNRAPILVPAYPHTSKNKKKDMERALWAIQNSIFPLEKLLSHKFNFSDIELAFSKNLKREKGFIKGLFIPKYQ